MGLSIAEQETVISFSRGSRTVDIYTSDTVLIARYDRFSADPEYPGWKKVKEYQDMITGEVVGCEYQIPRKLLQLFRKERPVREYTEKEKEELRERLKMIRMRKEEKKERGGRKWEPGIRRHGQQPMQNR